MQIEVDSENGVIVVNGTRISALALEAVCNADNRLLWRFEKLASVLIATPLSEREVIWLDRNEDETLRTMIGIE